jgi:hypothetical protein
MTLTLKIAGIEYDLWLGENVPLLILEIFGVSVDAFIGQKEIDGELLAKQLEENLNAYEIFKKIKMFPTRSQILEVLTTECEFTPGLEISDLNKLVRRISIPDLTAIVNQIFEVFVLNNQPPETEPDLIQEAAIAHSLISTDDEIFTQSNITEGE